MNAVQTQAAPMVRLSWQKHLLLIAILCVPGITWLSTTGNVADYWLYSVPAGQVIYLFSKLTGLYAFVVFWMQITYGLLGSRRARWGVEAGLAFHRRLGVLLISLAVAHVVLFLLGVGIRTQHFPVQYITPTFSSGYYRMIITLGMFAAMLLIVAFTFGLIRRVVPRIWRYVHWLAVPAYALAFVHSLLIGSESRIAPMTLLYAAMAGMVALALIWRARGV